MLNMHITGKNRRNYDPPPTLKITVILSFVMIPFKKREAVQLDFLSPSLGGCAQPPGAQLSDPLELSQSFIT